MCGPVAVIIPYFVYVQLVRCLSCEGGNGRIDGGFRLQRSFYSAAEVFDIIFFDVDLIASAYVYLYGKVICLLYVFVSAVYLELLLIAFQDHK